MLDPRYSGSRSMKRKAAEAYSADKKEVINTLGRLVYTYDQAIAAANREDKEELLKILSYMMNSINLKPAPEFALGLIRLYRAAQVCAEEERYTDVLHILTQMRDAWYQLKFAKNK